MDEKKQVDVPYSTIDKGMRIARDVEKAGITDFFKNMEFDERKVEFQRKTLKMGRWSVGIKGIIDYDKTTYGREREAMNELFADIAAAGDEMDTFATGVISMMQDADDLDEIDKEAAVDEDMREMYDISGLAEDFYDNYVEDGFAEHDNE